MVEMFEVWERIIINEIKNELDSSDIVWTKYGNQTKLELATILYKVAKREILKHMVSLKHF